MSLSPLLQPKPFNPAQTLQQALECHHGGRLVEAERLYSQVLAARPENVDALQMLGIIKLDRGELVTALQLVSEAMRLRPHTPQILVNYGMVLEALERYEEALAHFDAAIKRKSRFAEAHNNRGSVLTSLGRYDEALESFKRALAIKPDYAEAHYNRGTALRKLDRHQEALQSFDRALALRPTYAKAHCNRGAILEAIGRSEEALACFERTLALQPDFPEAMLNRTASLRSLRRYREALQNINALLARHPDYAEAYYQRGLLLGNNNRCAEATADYERALAIKPDYTKARWTSCNSVLPILYAEESEIARQRTEYERRLRALRTEYEAGTIPGDMSLGFGLAQPFLLPYQGYNDRELQTVLGGLLTQVAAKRYGSVELATPPAPGERIRVGIVSSFFRQHSVWKVGMRGWVTQLDPQRFQIFGYHIGTQCDGETATAKAHCDKFVQGPLPVEEWRKVIAADQPHIILYGEIGMASESAELAAMRLAPVQCSYLGHPQTSGMPTIDYFLSGELIEPADGDRHYSEKLQRLPNIAFHYEPLNLGPASVTRAQIGLRPSATAYWSAQSLFKYLPQHDEVFPRIAREVGDCQFVFLHHTTDEVTEQFKSRLERAFAAFDLKSADHCVFLPRMDTNHFAAAAAQCDLMLDSIGWSGGNTTLEAIAQDLPVVTHEGEFMRGRISAGILRMMGMAETIATTIDEYVALAARMGTDPAWRLALKARVIADREKLYRDRTCIVALEQFIERAARTQS
jgi:predicted O-linked N-acetylglucosamine transferase (SPINDLY family)